MQHAGTPSILLSTPLLTAPFSSLSLLVAVGAGVQCPLPPQQACLGLCAVTISEWVCVLDALSQGRWCWVAGLTPSPLLVNVAGL
ncbi:hypothetical protein GQ54DRAFT_166556 [Martensiomyces pterosporus]|nr:hypothetical protein GQ54DRAFT_166556 [Martensiomyces pterosporus]